MLFRSPEQQRWYAGETISLGIGQGYNNFTMLQLAQAVAIVASNGYRSKPHLVREVVDIETKEKQVERKAEALKNQLAAAQNALSAMQGQASYFQGSINSMKGATG